MNLIYKSLFDHQPFDGLSIIINTIKLFAKKEYKFGEHSNTENKDIYLHSDVTLLFEHSPSQASEIDHCEIFSCP